MKSNPKSKLYGALRDAVKRSEREVIAQMTQNLLAMRKHDDEVLQ